MKIVLLESLAIGNDVLNGYKEKLENMGHEFISYERNLDTEVLIERSKDADILMIANMPLKGEVIRACKNLKYINIAFTGVDHVDLEACKEMGVEVSNASGYSTESVAELALCMMISLLRNVAKVDERCREGKTKDGLVGFELMGKTVGIVGIGKIGLRTAELLNVFGCNIIAYNHREKEVPEFVKLVSLDELLEKSDIISLHCPLNAGTKGLIGEKEIAKMKKSAILINTARGAVVDSAALADALNNGDIQGAGIDVFETEPPLDTAHPLLSAKNTLVTPHIAFATKESMLLRAEIVFDVLDAYLKGERKNVIL